MGRCKKLTPIIGAEILDVDLSQPTGELIAFVWQVLLESHVVFFRNQDLSINQLKAFASRFGHLHIHPALKPQIPEHPELVILQADENTTAAPTEIWHSDATADPRPPLGSILHLLEVPPDGGGDTLWANTCKAYETLSPSLKTYLADKKAVHDAERLRIDIAQVKDERMVFSEHPVVRTHPQSGKKSLFVNRVYTSHIVGVPKPESDAILSYLYQHMEQEHFKCRFKWEPNSIAFWDNRCTLHAAVWDYHPNRRYGQRLTICGDVPV